MARWILFLSFCLFVTVPTSGQTQGLLPFETDYCTLFPEGTAQKPELWKHCCFEHDLRYWFGGSFSERDTADQFLKQCVQDAAGVFWARLIYAGVRQGHHSPIQHHYHWGWGWTPKRDNAPLNSSEKSYIRSELDELNLDRGYVEHFILKYNLN